MIKMRDLLNEMINFKELEKSNRITIPKIPVENIFKHNIKNISSIRKSADEYINNNLFESLPQKQIKIESIVPTQRSLNIDNLKKVKNTDQNTGAYLLGYKGKYYILDGHHRIAINILNGNDVVSAHVYEEK